MPPIKEEENNSPQTETPTEETPCSHDWRMTGNTEENGVEWKCALCSEFKYEPEEVPKEEK